MTEMRLKLLVKFDFYDVITSDWLRFSGNLDQWVVTARQFQLGTSIYINFIANWRHCHTTDPIDTSHWRALSCRLSFEIVNIRSALRKAFNCINLSRRGDASIAIYIAFQVLIAEPKRWKGTEAIALFTLWTTRGDEIYVKLLDARPRPKLNSDIFFVCTAIRRRLLALKLIRDEKSIDSGRGHRQKSVSNARMSERFCKLFLMDIFVPFHPLVPPIQCIFCPTSARIQISLLWKPPSWLGQHKKKRSRSASISLSSSRLLFILKRGKIFLKTKKWFKSSTVEGNGEHIWQAFIFP